MARCMSSRAPDGIDYHLSDSFGCASLHLYTTAEAENDIGNPRSDESGRFILSWSGRLDNRNQLTNQLHHHFPLRDNSDAELALRAYEHWGAACPQHLVGDFAFVVWDAKEQQLFCARDFLGVKPFYYWLSEKAFFWASEIKPIVLALPSCPAANPGMFTEYLSANIVSKTETAFDGIMRLEPGHSLTITRTEVSKVCILYYQCMI